MRRISGAVTVSPVVGVVPSAFNCSVFRAAAGVRVQGLIQSWRCSPSSRRLPAMPGTRITSGLSEGIGWGAKLALMALLMPVPACWPSPEPAARRIAVAIRQHRWASEVGSMVGLLRDPGRTAFGRERIAPSAAESAASPRFRARHDRFLGHRACRHDPVQDVKRVDVKQGRAGPIRAGRRGGAVPCGGRSVLGGVRGPACRSVPPRLPAAGTE